MELGGGQALAEAHAEAQLLVDGDLQRGDIRRFSQRLPEQRERVLQVVRLELGREEQRVGPRRSRRRGCDQIACEDPGALVNRRPRDGRVPRRSAAGEASGASGGVRRTACSPSSAATIGAPWSFATAAARSRAAAISASGSSAERARWRARTIGSSTSPRDRRCAPLPLGCGQSLIEHRREQRMREAHGAVGELEHVRGERLVERALLDSGGNELVGSQPCVRGREHERLMRRAREAVEPGRDELLELLGHDNRLSGVVGVVVERARELQRVERVAARHVVQPEECRSR